MNIKNHRNTRNSLPSLMLCWSLWVQWLHIFSNSWKRAWLKHTAWARQQSTQNTAARTHIISVWCENWCPKHHHTICLAFYFPAILLHRVDMQRYVSWCPVTTLTALLSSRDIPHPPKKRREGGPGVGCTPLRELMLHAPTGCSCLWWCYPDWGVPCAGTGAACAGCSALHRAVFGPSVEFAWQGLIFSVRGGRAAPAVQTAGLWVPKRQRHQGHHTKSILMFCLSCAVPYTAEKMALNSEELIRTKYSKVFPRTVTVFECLSKNAFRIKRNKQHCKWQTPFLSNLKSILIYFVSNSFHSKLRRFEMTAFKLFLLQSVTPWGNTMELAFIYQAKLKAFQREQYFILCLCSI